MCVYSSKSSLLNIPPAPVAWDGMFERQERSTSLNSRLTEFISAKGSLMKWRLADTPCPVYSWDLSSCTWLQRGMKASHGRRVGGKQQEGTGHDGVLQGTQHSSNAVESCPLQIKVIEDYLYWGKKKNYPECENCSAWDWIRKHDSHGKDLNNWNIWFYRDRLIGKNVWASAKVMI